MPVIWPSLLASWRQSPFARNVLVVMSGSAIAQALGFALSPVISRLFSPADFGVFGSFNAVITVIGAAATLEYSKAIVLPKDNLEAFHLFLASCLSTVGVTLLCLLTCCFLPGTVNGWMHTTGGWALALLVVATLATGLNAACYSWCVRAKEFSRTSEAQVLRSVSGNSLQIGSGLAHLGAGGLVASNLIADSLATLSLGRTVLRDWPALRGSVSWRGLISVIREYRDFPLYSSPQYIVNSLSSGLAVLLLTRYYGLAVAGSYAFGARMIQVPMGFILEALRQVIYQKASEAEQDGKKLGPLYLKTTVGLFTIAAVPVLVIVVCAPSVFAWVFGSQWRGAGEFGRWIVLWMWLVFSNLPAVIFARIIRIQRRVLMYDLLLFALRALALILGGRYLAAGQTICLFSLVGVLMNAVLIMMVGSAVLKREGGLSIVGLRNSLLNH